MGLFTRKRRPKPKPSILVREGARNHCCIGETIKDRYNYRGRHGDIVECMECGQLWKFYRADDEYGYTEWTFYDEDGSHNGGPCWSPQYEWYDYLRRRGLYDIGREADAEA